MSVKSIEDIKRCLIAKKDALNSSDHDYSFSFLDSRKCFPNDQNKISLNAYLCLHAKNYKTILVDKTDWIYCEIVDFSAGSDDSKSHLHSSHLENLISVPFFLAVIERFRVNSNDKFITYIQVDLKQCDISPEKSIHELLDQQDTIPNELQISILKCQELKKLLVTSETIKSEIIDDTLEEINDSIICLNESEKHFYLFKVNNIGLLHSLTNSQFSSKLRADINIEIFRYDRNFEPKSSPVNVVLALMGKFIFYYNFLFTGSYYLLSSEQELKLNFDSESSKPVASLLFVDESMRIIDEFEKPEWLENRSLNTSTTNLNLNADFLTSLDGILVEKKLAFMGNRENLQFKFRSSKFNTDLMDYYDLIIPNREFKLVINIADDQLVTIYYDCKFFLYQLCVLPGMRVKCTNLVRKSSMVYKSSTSLHSCFVQNIDFSGLNSINKLPQPKLTMNEKISNLENIFTNIYQPEEEADVKKSLTNDDRLNLMLGEASTRSIIRVLAQIVRIYELSLRLQCKNCNMLATSCRCPSSNATSTKEILEKYKFEFSIAMLIDDHSSVLKITYTNSNYDIKNKFNFFEPISDFLVKIMFKYLSEIRMPMSIPLVIQDLSDSLDSILTKNISDILNDDSNSENGDMSMVNELFQVKIDIYKTIYEFISNTIIDRHMIFYIDKNDLNTRSSKIKLAYNYFKLAESSSNIQFKGIIGMRCVKYVPVNIELSEN